MPLRPCLDCGIPTVGSRCEKHRKAVENARVRPSAHRRGYDAAHRAARRRLELTLPAPCAYGCGRILEPGSSWVAAHVEDGNPDAGWQASCRHCNELAKRR